MSFTEYTKFLEQILKLNKTKKTRSKIKGLSFKI